MSHSSSVHENRYVLRPKRKKSPLVRIKKSLRELVMLVAKLTPVEFQHKIYRYFTRVPQNISELYTFCEARTQEDFAAAAKIVHDRYVKLNILKQNQSGLRLSVYLALPTTTTLVAKYKGRVVGTVSLIRESRFSLPMEKVFDLSSMRATGDRLCEISSLAVLEEFAGDKSVSFGLFKYLFQYSSCHQGIDKYVICVHPKSRRFYEAVFGFSMVHKKSIVIDGYLEGAPAIAMTWDVRREICVPLLSRLFDGAPKSRNVKEFLFSEMPSAILPSAPYYATEVQPLPTDDLVRTFIDRDTVFHDLTPEELGHLKVIYADTGVVEHLPRVDKEKVELASSPGAGAPPVRYRVDCPVRAKVGDQVLQGRLHNVSASGCLIKFDSPGADVIDAMVDAVVELGPQKFTTIQAVTVWSRANGLVGVELEATSIRWSEFVRDLHEIKVQKPPLAA